MGQQELERGIVGCDDQVRALPVVLDRERIAQARQVFGPGVTPRIQVLLAHVHVDAGGNQPRVQSLADVVRPVGRGVVGVQHHDEAGLGRRRGRSQRADDEQREESDPQGD